MSHWVCPICRSVLQHCDQQPAGCGWELHTPWRCPPSEPGSAGPPLQCLLLPHQPRSFNDPLWPLPGTGAFPHSVHHQRFPLLHLKDRGGSASPEPGLRVLLTAPVGCGAPAVLFSAVCMQWSGVFVRENCNVEPKEAVDILQFQNDMSNQTMLNNVPGACVSDTATIDIVCGEGGEGVCVWRWWGGG